MSLSSPLFTEALDLSSIEGVLEGVQNDALSGWVWNTRYPELELWVEVIGPDFYKKVRAAEYRPDLASAGKRQGLCWFNVPVPATFSDAAAAEAVALLAGTSHRLRPVSEGNRLLEQDWLDKQSLGRRVAVNAQRVRLGLRRPPLSKEQVAELVRIAAGTGLDLSQLVDATAQQADT